LPIAFCILLKGIWIEQKLNEGTANQVKSNGQRQLNAQSFIGQIESESQSPALALTAETHNDSLSGWNEKNAAVANSEDQPVGVTQSWAIDTPLWVGCQQFFALLFSSTLYDDTAQDVSTAFTVRARFAQHAQCH